MWYTDKPTDLNSVQRFEFESFFQREHKMVKWSCEYSSRNVNICEVVGRWIYVTIITLEINVNLWNNFVGVYAHSLKQLKNGLTNFNETYCEYRCRQNSTNLFCFLPPLWYPELLIFHPHFCRLTCFLKCYLMTLLTAEIKLRRWQTN
jgi:hypothetical protein